MDTDQVIGRHYNVLSEPVRVIHEGDRCSSAVDFFHIDDRLICYFIAVRGAFPIGDRISPGRSTVICQLIVTDIICAYKIPSAVIYIHGEPVAIIGHIVSGTRFDAIRNSITGCICDRQRIINDLPLNDLVPVLLCAYNRSLAFCS